MKIKILSFLAVVVLVVAMAVPVFAEDTTFIKGSWVFNDTLDFTGIEDYLYANDVPFIINGSNKYGGSAITGFRLTGGAFQVLVDNNGEQSVKNLYTSSGFSSSVTTPVVLDFGKDGFFVSNVIYEWLNRNAVLQTCDGSTCPANDDNQDGFCDDCGMMLRMVSPVPDPYTVWTESKRELYPYALIYTDNNGSDWLILSKNPAIVTDGAITIATGSHVRYSVFGTSWNLVSSYDEYSTYGNIAEVYPSYNIRNEAGTIVYPYNGDFFPLPLWSQMEMVTQGEMGQLILETVGTTKVLILCGVGLMALLLVLSLFGKRSLIFLR